MDALRIGGVPYRVGAALVAGLDRHPGVELRLEPPARLVAALRAGELDAALLSSIESFRRPGYRALPDLGIACDGPVRSVRLFLRTEPALVRTLAVDSGSETSVALARLVLARRYGATLGEIVRIEPTLEPDAVDADAVLLIGDQGLYAGAGPRAVLDLGNEWRSWYGLPFVFAIWLLPPATVAAAAASAEDDREGRVAAELRAAWARGRQEGINDGTGGAIQYELGADHLRALRRFRDEAAALELCEPDLEPGWLPR